jgi:hypothetical protein
MHLTIVEKKFHSHCRVPVAVVVVHGGGVQIRLPPEALLVVCKPGQELHGVDHQARVIQGCQMVCLQTKNSNLGKFWRALEWENVDVIYGHLVYFMALWYI